MNIDSFPAKKRMLLTLLALPVGAALLLLLSLFYECPFSSLTGIPCPGCGITRALRALFALDMHGAFVANPAVFVVVLYGALFLLALALGKTAWFQKPWVWGVFCGVMLGVYIVRMVLYFPHTYPMQPNPDGWIPRIFRLLFG